jgi:hydroxymethylpyrimidine/phosphomethylpyrimidine kinase
VTLNAHKTPRVLSIAGSDSGGGAGIQADLKAFARCGVHGMTAITAVTVQNTVGVSAVHEVPGAIILGQVRAVVSDIGVDAVKVGMLASAEIVLAVAEALEELEPATPVVVDPVMVSETGAVLLAPDARGALVERILPRATVATPNLAEARALLASAGPHGAAGAGGASGEEADPETLTPERLARSVLALGPGVVVLTGGHLEDVTDLYLERGFAEPVRIAGERHPSGAAHGSGCTHSSILAARLALGDSPLQAARVARGLAGQAVADGLQDVGAGPGPVDVLGLARARERAGRLPGLQQGTFAHLP